VDRAGNSKSPQHVMTFDPSEPASAYSPAIEQRFGKYREAQIVMTRDVIQRLVLRGRPLFFGPIAGARTSILEYGDGTVAAVLPSAALVCAGPGQVDF
jgi:hypothetical protein